MKKNVGIVDRYVRMGAGIALVVIGTVGINSPIVGILGLIVMATAVFRFCGLYTLLGINTACDIKNGASKEEEKKRVDRLFAAPAKLAEAGFLFATNTRTSV